MLELAFFSYAAVMSITPGPNNLMLAASGVNYGFRRTLPHLLGITAGVSIQLFLVALLLGPALSWFGIIRKVLAVIGCVYLLWLSWKLARAGQIEAKQVSKPLTFGQALLFQAVNPKAWVMVINSALLFIPRDLNIFLGISLMVSMFALVNLPCVSVWALAGDRLRRLLSAPRALRIFNVSMGALMGITALYLVAEELLGKV